MHQDRKNQSNSRRAQQAPALYAEDHSRWTLRRRETTSGKSQEEPCVSDFELSQSLLWEVQLQRRCSWGLSSTATRRRRPNRVTCPSIRPLANSSFRRISMNGYTLDRRSLPMRSTVAKRIFRSFITSTSSPGRTRSIRRQVSFRKGRSFSRNYSRHSPRKAPMVLEPNRRAGAISLDRSTGL